ncbi:nicotinate phosphoribosyltransferase [Thalassorhabdomicrobium marinisediminis]|uniref:Nicotinate phosphoribosyltransferase n=1 Tax=Thalassorhabdomicrobium marinisediminis TaxID=2170577 RepID=A0A2T7FWE7_9RHOB|nr:nicotinate phosphoribosyltransferase [Thalassorhabdomicrobium marinisediminis]
MIYVLIPLGFVLLVAFMMLGGEAVQETTDGSVADPVEEQLD